MGPSGRSIGRGRSGRTVDGDRGQDDGNAWDCVLPIAETAVTALRVPIKYHWMSSVTDSLSRSLSNGEPRVVEAWRWRRRWDWAWIAT